MAKPSSAADTPLRDQLETLAAFEPHDVPVVSLYLNLEADQHGRDRHDLFVRKTFTEHVKVFPESSAERASLERDIEKIQDYLANELRPSTNGLALFASAGAAEFFEAIQLEAPFPEHWFFLGAVPHVYPLVRLIDQYPRYASVLLDTQQARIFVFALGAIEKREEVTGVKTRRTSMGGWSQARYQRRAENFHLHHIKEVVDTLDRIVRADKIQHVIVSGDDVVVALFKEHLPAALAGHVVELLKIDWYAGEDAVVEATLEVLRRRDTETDAEYVSELLDAWQSGGLGVVGPRATLDALKLGQVEELLITTAPQTLTPITLAEDHSAARPVIAETSASAPADPSRLSLSEELVVRAQQTGSRVRFIEDHSLLQDVGGVGALLRFRL